MTLEWVVYAARRGSELMYIGKTGNLRARSEHHRYTASWAQKCTFSVMRRASSEADALRIEKRLIRKHRPPFNIQNNPGRPREGMLGFEEARRIWHSCPTVMDRVLLAEMPGWTKDRANRAFGQRQIKKIWRKPRVMDGPTCINAKLYRIAYHPEPRRPRTPAKGKSGTIP